MIPKILYLYIALVCVIGGVYLVAFQRNPIGWIGIIIAVVLDAYYRRTSRIKHKRH